MAEIKDLQQKLLTIGKEGFRHHVSVTSGHVAAQVREAFSNYLGYDMIEI